MEKVRCEECGKQIAIKDSVSLFDIGSSHTMVLCMKCYYKKLLKEEEKKDE